MKITVSSSAFAGHSHGGATETDIGHWRSAYQGLAVWMLIGVVILALASCSRDDDVQRLVGDAATPADTESPLPELAAEYFENALGHIARKDYPAALIDFKNALQQAPNSLVTRIEMGKTMLALGYPLSAQNELLRARDLGAHPDIVSLPLAQAFLDQNKLTELEREATQGGRKPQIEAQLLLLLAEARLRQRDIPGVIAALDRAHQLDPHNVLVWVRRAALEFEQGDTDAARNLIAKAEAIAPLSGDVWAFKARLSMRDGDYDTALTAQQKAHELAPDDRVIQIGLARLWLVHGQVQTCLDMLAPLYRPELPEPELSFVYAQALAQSGDMAAAERVIDDAAALLAGADSVVKAQNPSLFMLSALFAYIKGELELARKQATMLVQILPRHLEARYLLAQIMIALREPDEVVGILEPVSDKFSNNGPILLLYGTALRELGRARDARPILEKAATLVPESSRARVELALAHIVLNDFNAAIEILEQVTGDGAELDLASGAALVAALVRENDRARALEVAQTLISRYPESAAAETLIGELKINLADIDGARAHLERALNLDPTYARAVFRLAELEHRAGKLDEARALYLKLVEAEPQHVGAMFGLARIAEKRGELTTAYEWMEKLRVIAPRAAPEILYLIDLYRRTGKIDEALRIAEKLAGSLPEDAGALIAYGQMLGQIGRVDQARIVLRRSSRFAGYNSAQLKLLAARQMELGDYEGTRATLDKALQSVPGDSEAIVQLIHVDMQEGDYEAALAHIEKLPTSFESTGLQHFLRAEVFATAGRDEDAIREFRAALVIKSDANLVERIHALQMKSGRIEEAAETLEQWLAAHPGEPRLKHLLAATYLQKGAPERAEVLLRELLEENPENASAMNNLAWLLTERGDETGLQLAARAFDLSPTDPQTLDTYGWSLVQAGQYEQGLQKLREAIARGGESPGFRYRLAYALHKMSRDPEALVILQQLLSAELKFPEQDAAIALRAEIEH